MFQSGGWRHLLRRFFRDESGQDVVEYALLAAFLALAVAGSVAMLGMNMLLPIYKLVAETVPTTLSG